ncbi:MAG: hypothetical protein CMB80_01830 [Flammeovirgaceae bacterium]|nr:hypothetical protein [Flammeovirgaceae bacterium]|tara:strand:- start:171 stop:461 length:291 start_codon:yes stop_codon:yes gene_type:complete
MNRRTFIKSISLFLLVPWIPLPKIEAAPEEEGYPNMNLGPGAVYPDNYELTRVHIDGINEFGLPVSETVELPKGAGYVTTKHTYMKLSVSSEWQMP